MAADPRSPCREGTRRSGRRNGAAPNEFESWDDMIENQHMIPAADSAPVSAAVSPADTPALCPGSKGNGCDCRMNGTDPGCPFMPGHDIRPMPSVSPADTPGKDEIEAFIAASPWGYYVPSVPDTPVVEWGFIGWARFALALLAVGERDRPTPQFLDDVRAVVRDHWSGLPENRPNESVWARLDAVLYDDEGHPREHPDYTADPLRAVLADKEDAGA